MKAKLNYFFHLTIPTLLLPLLGACQATGIAPTPTPTSIQTLPITSSNTPFPTRETPSPSPN
jgi:hypothetical protein